MKSENKKLRNLAKYALLVITSLLITGVCAELFSRIYLAIDSYDYKRSADVAKNALLDTKHEAITKPEELYGPGIIHPYIGFVHDVAKDKELNEFGFWGEQPLGVRDSQHIRIAVFGGSFAGEFIHNTKEYLTAILQKHPHFSDKVIDYSMFVAGGMKQPQQLMALNYFLTLGAQYDIVINIDGYNEVALPFLENQAHGIHPVYPRSWFFYAQQTLNISQLRLIQDLESLKNRKLFIQKAANHHVLGRSGFVSLLSQIALASTENAINRKNIALFETFDDTSHPYAVTGPTFDYSQQDSVERVVQIWSNSSKQMHDLAAGNGALYLHILQPNQYISGSKPLSPEERSNAIVDDQYRVATIQNGYELLREQVKTLRSHSVHALDATSVYHNHPETLYIDDCCHVNALGYALFADFVSQAIIDEYAYTQN